MQVVLHAAKLNSLFGVVCSLATLSGYSHASVIDNEGRRWDTTLERGYFCRTSDLALEPDREVVIIDLPGVDPGPFLHANVGREYDALGLLLWPWRRQNPARWYCFEAVDCCLMAAGVDLQLGGRLSAKALLDGLLAAGYSAEVTKGRYYAYNKLTA